LAILKKIPTSTNRYDAIVVGAGVAGCNIAYQLHQKGLRVLIVNQSHEVANGGSGAAGAFVSPKIGKGSPLLELTNASFRFAKDFYCQHFPAHFHQSGVVRIPKDTKDNDTFPLYAEHNSEPFCDVSPGEIEAMGIASQFGGFLFEQAGFCQSKEMCEALIKGIDFKALHVTNITQTDEGWRLNHLLHSRYLILATGYQNSLIDMRYMGIRGTWGSRGDFKTTLPITASIHKDLSISQNVEGVIKIGATHNKSHTPCLTCHNTALDSLLQKASSLIDISKLELLDTFCGMRSGSQDYFPLVGGVVDVEYMFAHYPKLTQGQKATLKMRDNLFVLNGLGGRGFVFAPLMAHALAEHIVEKRALDSRIDPNRLFLRWARRLKN